MSSPTATDLVDARAALKDVPFNDDEIESLAREAVAIALSDARVKNEQHASAAAGALRIVAAQMAALIAAVEDMIDLYQVSLIEDGPCDALERITKAYAALAAVKGDA